TTPDHAETPGHDHNLKQALGRLPGLLGVGDGAAVVLGPVVERLDRPDERGPELGQAVFDAACRPGATVDQAVALEPAQGLGEHLARDAAHEAHQLAVAAGAPAE